MISFKTSIDYHKKEREHKARRRKTVKFNNILKRKFSGRGGVTLIYAVSSFISSFTGINSIPSYLIRSDGNTYLIRSDGNSLDITVSRLFAPHDAHTGVALV